ncbi:hypothetical protein THRCLA_21342 [Thraustotheca clavata]|uniref:Uncharacterized protein n=1 Tax=Thraustotheca clavata TaxID=74557 RepID=A0A1V9ZY51_9STRA|nr:hypothetical protein THRCLA_21342 [Thraustotheca clavata]
MAFPAPDGAVSGLESEMDHYVYPKATESIESGTETAPSTPVPLDGDFESSDDEPLSNMKKNSKRKPRLQQYEDEELALAESNSEDELYRQEVLHDYSYDGELEVLHVPRVTYPFPLYLCQLANNIDASNHPLLAMPEAYANCQNHPLKLGRLASQASPREVGHQAKRARKGSVHSDVDISDVSMMSDS